ncbi:MAG TPA: HAD family hydrolase [Solirubrobacteraceae bacterium]|jgi:HAD superfamily hydrolase (TIGR01509 family)|nr:HAD family hydrolase [Solirubrobacteraceae bacterium]
MSVAILDIDGTLVDTNYQHALAWYRAFRESGIVLPIWRIHRHIGMGGDQLVGALTDRDVEARLGDRIRSREGDRYAEMIDEVEPMEGAGELLRELHDRGHTVILASSAKESEVEHYVDLLGARRLVEAWTSSGDVESTKPRPDLVQVALERAGSGPEQAVMVGDSPWDVEAAERAGVQTLAVMTGGFAREELCEAGAAAVYESVAELCSGLDRTPLGGSA